MVFSSVYSFVQVVRVRVAFKTIVRRRVMANSATQNQSTNATFIQAAADKWASQMAGRLTAEQILKLAEGNSDVEAKLKAIASKLQKEHEAKESLLEELFGAADEILAEAGTTIVSPPPAKVVPIKPQAPVVEATPEKLQKLAQNQEPEYTDLEQYLPEGCSNLVAKTARKYKTRQSAAVFYVVLRGVLIGGMRELNSYLHRRETTETHREVIRARHSRVQVITDEAKYAAMNAGVDFNADIREYYGPSEMRDEVISCMIKLGFGYILEIPVDPAIEEAKKSEAQKQEAAKVAARRELAQKLLQKLQGADASVDDARLSTMASRLAKKAGGDTDVKTIFRKAAANKVLHLVNEGSTIESAIADETVMLYALCGGISSDEELLQVVETRQKVILAEQDAAKAESDSKRDKKYFGAAKPKPKKKEKKNDDKKGGKKRK